jgi:hypothetical protein
VEAEALWPDGRRVFVTTNFTANAANIVWVDDALPTGAVGGSDGGDSWNWINSNPGPELGNLSHQSALATGQHQHYFDNATATLTLGTGDTLYTWVYLDPVNPPTEIMLQWNDGGWEHRAYWGANTLQFGLNATASRRYMGELPATGRWVQLLVPAVQVGLEGSTLKGMAFTLFGGKASWDAAGRTSQMTTGSTVGVSATTGTASRLNGTPGTFTLTRSGDTSNALTVNITLSGSATNGVDYQLPNGASASTIVIPPGSNSASLNIVPLTSSNAVPGKSVVMTVTDGAGYQAGAPGSASVTVDGNGVQVSGITAGAGGPRLSWPATANHTYRILYKNDLQEANWTVAANVLATSGTLTWTDSTAATVPQRFYLVTQVN